MTGPAGPASVVIQRRIEWPSTDGSGHYHYSTVFALIEAAEALLYDRVGIGAGEVFGRAPRVRVQAQFHAVLRFGELVETHLAVAAVGSSSVTFDFAVRRGEVHAVEGQVVAVLLDQPEGHPTAWPRQWRVPLLTAGPQPGEVLSAAQDPPPRPLDTGVMP